MTMLKLFVVLLLVTPSISFAASDSTMPILYGGLIAGMLLSSWLCTILITQNSVRRIIDLVIGVSCLAFLATAQLWVLAFVAIFLLAETLFVTKIKGVTRALMISGSWLLLFLVVTTIVYLAHLSPAWSVFVIVAKQLFVVIGSHWYTQSKLHSLTQNKPLTIDEQNLLPDRSTFINTYKEWLAVSPSKVVVLIKLDGIAAVNHNLGHEFGDLVLAQVSSKINRLLASQYVMPMKKGGETAYLTHLSGVDYVFAVDTDIEQHLHQKLIYQIHELVENPVSISNANAEVVLSAAYAKDDKRAGVEEVIANCYLAIEQTSKQFWCVEFTPELAEKHQQQLDLLHDLKQINIEDELQLYFQPVVNMKDNSIEFLELLLRWHHPSRGTLEASDFITEIRLAGLTMQIARWVVVKAAELGLALKLEGIHIPVSVNLFGPELLQDEFIEFIEAQKEEHDLISSEMIIECPAQVFSELDDHGDGILRRLKALNVSVCLDDLGAAPLLLSQLPRMPLGFVKVDGSIVRELTENVNSRSLLSGIIDMSNSLNVKVICEGVESEVHYTHITTMKCDAAQGYLFTRPISTQGIIGWVKQWQKKLDDNKRPY